MRDVRQLAQLAQDAKLSTYVLARIQMLATPMTATGIAFDDTVLPLWQAQVVGQVRLAAQAALAFMAGVDADL